MTVAGGWRSALLTGAVLAVTAVSGAISFAPPASAQVRVKADKTLIGSVGPVLTFTATPVSQVAGIRSEQVYLPDGILPADVQLVSGPSGWKLKPGLLSVIISGPALDTGETARWKLKVAFLPVVTAPTVAFPTWETYSDGTLIKWAEVAGIGDGVADRPAPLLKVTDDYAPAGKATLPIDPVAPPGVVTGKENQPVPVAATSFGSDGLSSTSLVVGIGIVAIAAAGVVSAYRRRRRWF